MSQYNPENGRFLAIPAEDRFWSKVDSSGGPDACWIWKAAKYSTGYGVFRFNGHNAAAHRVAYELVIGEIPEDFQLDHLCRVHDCVNPQHLEPVTNKENGRRGIAAEVNRALRLASSHCRNGHLYDGRTGTQKNRRTGGRSRSCCECRNLRQRKTRTRQRTFNVL